MKQYVRQHVVNAKEMTRKEYNELRGWTVPENENPEDEGYFIKYPDGYVSWCPKEQFEESATEYPDMEPHLTSLLQNENTKVNKQLEFKYNARHGYSIVDSNNRLLNFIHFQEGPVKECGVNGITEEALISIVIDRLECFQDSAYSCEENAEARKKFIEGLSWLKKRTADRKLKNIEGTSAVK